jgi:beta-glucosidase
MPPRANALVNGLALVAVAGLAASCNPLKQSGDLCDAAIRAVGLPCTDPEALRTARLLRAMTLQEKVQQMSGPASNPNNMMDQEDNVRLGIPGYRFMDGPRGVRWYNTDYGTTVFPVSAARGATWNAELERRVGKAMADEMRYLGRHVLLAPTINQVMHPRWGRAQETYGEDSFLLGAMGSAFIAGVQYDPALVDSLDPGHAVDPAAYRIQACAKHFAANNIEDTRVYVNAVVDERTLREVYLPHFKKAVDAGVSCTMASYNRVNGSYSGYSKANVRDILKKEWGYRGWVVSDWFAKGNTLASPVAGLDVEMPFSSGAFPSIFDSAYFYGALLVSAVQAGTVDEKLVDEAVFRILYRKIHFGVLDRWNEDLNWSPSLTKSAAAQGLALQAAEQGMVLLKNGPTRALGDDVLPLDATALHTVAVIGKFANVENTGDLGSSWARVMDNSLLITPYEGLKARLAATNASPSSCGGAAKCALAFQSVSGNEAALRAADVIFVVAAYYPADLARSAGGEEGEWKDRASMSLPQRDLDNIAAAVALKGQNPSLKIVVVMKSGGAVVTPWVDGADAVIMAWYGGMKEGTALAEIVFGDVNPSGKVVQSFPFVESDLPAFDQGSAGTDYDVTYGYYHGYRWLDRQNVAPRWPFGFGLSYTTFQYSNLVVATPTISDTGTLTVKVDVKNTGTRPGSEVVQLYVGYPHTAVADAWGRPKKELKGFARLEDLAPGATRTVTLTVNASDLAYWNVVTKRMTVEHVPHALWVGPSSDANDPNTLAGTFTVQ